MKNKFESNSGLLAWFMALLLVALAAGCGGGGGGGRDPILGTPGAGALVPPTVTAVAPLNNAVGVGINNTIINVTFSEPMAAITGGASFTVACTAACAKTPTGTVALDTTNTIATFTVTNSPLLPLTSYTATVTGARSLATGLPLANAFVWRFTTGVTPDTTRPSVTLTVPADAAVNVPTNAAITAVFSEEMAPATIFAAGTFAVTGPGATPVAGTVTYVVGSRTAVFTPAAPARLAAGTIYTATITGAATDLAGNALIVPAVGGLPVPNPWTFTTAPTPDTTPPVVNSTIPANGANNVGVGQNISATFNETMNAASVVSAFTLTAAPGAVPVNGVVTYDAATSIATFNPSNPLTAGVTYTARIGPTARDLAGNALVVPAVGGLPVPNPWTFSIPAVPPPPPPVVNLGAAAPFGAFGGPAGITNQGLLTVINGDIGTTGASTLITGFHDPGVGCTYTETPLNVGTVNGTIFTAAPPPTPACATEGTAATFAVAAQALLDAQTAFNTLAGLPNGIDVGTAGAAGPGELGGRTLAPGVYKSAPGTYGITLGNLTLDAQGDPNASWVFQMGTSLTVGIAGPAGARSVILINGAQAKNVFWQVGSSATINAAGGGTMVGTIISSAATTFSTAGNAAITTLNGRAMALAASVTMVNTHINVPAP